MSKVKLIWSTPEGEDLVAYMARVSNPENQDNKATAGKLTMSRMYMKGTLRNWIHYLEVRCDPATQKEHREVALLIKEQLLKCYPTMEYLWKT